MNNKKRKRRPNAKAIKRLKIMLICSICAVVLCLIVCIILIIKGAGDEKPDDKKASDTINIVIPDSTAAYTAPSVTDSSAEPAVTLPPVTLPPAADTTVQTEEPADSKSENENKAHVIFVGDSRYDGMVSYKEETDEFFCKVGASHSLIEQQYDNIVNAASPDSIIVFGMGVNECGYSEISAYQYLELVKKIKEETGAKVVVQLVCSVNEEQEKLHYETVIKQSEVDMFNSILKEELAGTDIPVVDLQAELDKADIKTIDGLHYNLPDYERMYGMLKQIVLAALGI
jgi:hypothetical protein